MSTDHGVRQAQRRVVHALVQHLRSAYPLLDAQELREELLELTDFYSQETSTAIREVERRGELVHITALVFMLR